jgi:hypothetical protein
MSDRKYLSEFGLNMVNDWTVLLQQDMLDSVDQAGIDPHIYLIGRRPRITLDPRSVKITSERVTGVFRKQVRDTVADIPFDVPNLTKSADIGIRCDYPYTEYMLLGADGERVGGGKCALLMASFGTQFWQHLDLEVLYVGQAVGRTTSRSATARLRAHETLQGIYAEALRQSPDQDIWLVLPTFKPLLLASFDGRTQTYATTLQEDSEHIERVLRTGISELQETNFTEAALIKYFAPPYNKVYKDTFPNPAHTSYSECYDVDLNMVAVELNTEAVGIRLWSENAKPEWIHFCTFPLHSREDRVYMFELDGKPLI